MKIAAVIATRFDPPQLRVLTDLLQRDGVQIVIEHDGEHEPGWSLYRLWNRGVEWAKTMGAEYICVMNDDVMLVPTEVRMMALFLADHPEWGVVYPDVRVPTKDDLSRYLVPDWTGTHSTVGTWGAGGMTGFCFMFRADLGIPFDEGYQLWYGDDAFEEAVRARGLLVCRIDGLPIDHVPGYTTALLPADEVQRMIEADRQRWEHRTYSAMQRQPVTA